MVSKRRIATPFGLAATAVLALLAGATPAAQAGDTRGSDKDVAAVRAATAKYHDEGRAVADGYLRTDDCVSLSGLGVMGFHYVNPALMDEPLDVRKPAVLIYQPSPNGERKLVAVEYLAVDRDQDVATDDDRPALFGVDFDGPMPGHGEGMPVHYDLHAWIWQHNPEGMFAQFDPAGRC